MAMTKKDYSLVAKALAAQRQTAEADYKTRIEAVDATAQTIAAYFALENDRFDSEKFLSAARGEA